VRDWAELREETYRGVTPESDADTSFGTGYETDGMLPLSPPASSSEGEEIDDRFGPHALASEEWTDYHPRAAAENSVVGPSPPRRSQRIVDQQARKVVALETTATRGRTRRRGQ